MKEFLRGYTVASVMFTLGIIISCYLGENFLYRLWSSQYSDSYFPYLLVLTLPAVITLLSCLAARLFAFRIRLLDFRVKSVLTDIVILIVLVLAGYLLGTYGYQWIDDDEKVRLLATLAVCMISVPSAMLIILVKYVVRKITSASPYDQHEPEENKPGLLNVFSLYFISSVSISVLCLFGGIILLSETWHIEEMNEFFIIHATLFLVFTLIGMGVIWVGQTINRHSSFLSQGFYTFWLCIFFGISAFVFFYLSESYDYGDPFTGLNRQSSQQPAQIDDDDIWRHNQYITGDDE